MSNTPDARADPIQAAIDAHVHRTLDGTALAIELLLAGMTHEVGTRVDRRRLNAVVSDGLALAGALRDLAGGHQG